MRETPIDSLNELREQKDALDQSVALNHIVMAMLESKRRRIFGCELSSSSASS